MKLYVYSIFAQLYTTQLSSYLQLYLGSYAFLVMQLGMPMRLYKMYENADTYLRSYAFIQFYSYITVHSLYIYYVIIYI